MFTAISKTDTIKDTKLSDRDIARIIKKWISALGLDHTSFAGHSLRSGFITTAALSTQSPNVIMQHSRHKSANAPTLVGL